jgi:serine/threonine-protein kinase
MVAPGSVLAGRYRLAEVLDGGGLGVVWRATDVHHDEIAAIKTYDCTDLDAGAGPRFVAETRIVALISDPGVVPLRHHGFDAPFAWVVMPLLAGESLRARLAHRGPVAPDLAMHWLAQAATAVQAVHRHGVVHAGLRPARLIVLADDRVVLTEFGHSPAARFFDVSSEGAAYLTPELARCEMRTVATDIYQLGVIAYECLAGIPPFAAENPFEVAMMHVRHEPPPLSDVVPAPVRAVVARCLAKDERDRWPSAAVLAEAAEQAVSPGRAPR